MIHVPVLVSEVAEYLITDKCGIYLDATVGEGGHSHVILSQLDQRGKLICTDRDEQAIKEAKNNLAKFGGRAVFQKLAFSELRGYLKELRMESISGILFDLGISSAQIEDPGRGFSYLVDAPLDMRMDQSQSKTASDVVNFYDKQDLTEILLGFGEERYSKAIATAIIKTREKGKIRTTGQLRRVIQSRVNPKYEIKSLARVFQALRIEVNRELEELDEGLDTVVDFLRPNGRVCVITYHSLEDRTVKNRFRQFSQACMCHPSIPSCTCGQKQLLKILTKKPIIPTSREVKENPRSRSAKLRVASKNG